MHPKAKPVHRRVPLRYIVAIIFSVSSAFLSIAVFLHWSGLFLDVLPLGLFSLITFAGIIICAANTALIGQIKFNRLAITIGTIVGSFVALTTAQIEPLPYRLLLALFFTSLITAVATLVFPSSRRFRGETDFLSAVHVVITLLVLIGLVYSLLFPWAQPIMWVICVCGLLLWSPLIMGGCPVTLLESNLRTAQGETCHLWEEGFIDHHVKKLLKIDLSRGLSGFLFHAIAVGILLFWIYSVIVGAV